VLERRAPPTFDVLIEIQDRQRMAVHRSVAAAVDGLLRGRPLTPEIRRRDETGKVRIEAAPASPSAEARAMLAGASRLPFDKQPRRLLDLEQEARAEVPTDASRPGRPVRIHPYGVGRGRLLQAAQNLGVPITIVTALDEAGAVITLKNYYRKHPQPIADAERRHIPVYVLRANTVNQMEACLGDIFGLMVEPEDPMEQAIAETQEAIHRVLAGSASEELRPADAEIRRMQHEMARAANLVSHSYGNEPRRRVRIFPG
jgi:hypothetical protein